MIAVILSAPPLYARSEVCCSLWDSRARVEVGMVLRGRATGDPWRHTVRAELNSVAPRGLSLSAHSTHCLARSLRACGGFRVHAGF